MVPQILPLLLRKREDKVCWESLNIRLTREDRVRGRQTELWRDSRRSGRSGSFADNCVPKLELGNEGEEAGDTPAATEEKASTR